MEYEHDFDYFVKNFSCDLRVPVDTALTLRQERLNEKMKSANDAINRLVQRGNSFSDDCDNDFENSI